MLKHIRINYDPEITVWWAESDDVPGLVAEAKTLEALIEEVKLLVPELMEENEPDAVDITLVFDLMPPSD